MRILALAILLSSAPAWATKPCQSEPCGDEGVGCKEKASWIAVGRIEALKHNRQGPPLSKDFASFTLVVVRWEKELGKDRPERIQFSVRWCENRQGPSGDKGLFRVYGANAPSTSEKDGGALYYRIEPVEPQAR